MASLYSASLDAPPTAKFGAWLRHLRESKDMVQRVLAAAADMDSSHLGKVERGERLPTAEQVAAMARKLGVDENDAKARLMAAKLIYECEGDTALAFSAAGLVQEDAAPYLVNKPANKPGNKLRDLHR